MKQEGAAIEDREVVDMRLLAFLRELARDHGRKKAAAMLGVDRRTLDAGLDEGALSRRMRSALDRALQSGLRSAAAEQRERNDKLEERVEALEKGQEAHEKGHDELGKELRRRLAGIEGVVEALRRDDGLGVGPGQAGVDGPEAGVTARGGKPPSKPRLRREYPQLVTLEPAEDDADVFGEAWPLIAEWREIRNVHPIQGKGFKWLTEHKRLLELELTLLEEHEMTMPPEKQPLRGLDRSGQTTHRWTAFYETRRSWFWRWRVRQLLRCVTFGRCWRELPSDPGSIPQRDQWRSTRRGGLE